MAFRPAATVYRPTAPTHVGESSYLSMPILTPARDRHNRQGAIVRRTAAVGPGGHLADEAPRCLSGCASVRNFRRPSALYANDIYCRGAGAAAVGATGGSDMEGLKATGSGVATEATNRPNCGTRRDRGCTGSAPSGPPISAGHRGGKSPFNRSRGNQIIIITSYRIILTPWPPDIGVHPRLAQLFPGRKGS